LAGKGSGGTVFGIGRGSGPGTVIVGRVDVDSLIGSTETREFDTTKDIDIGIGIHPRDPRISLIRNAGL